MTEFTTGIATILVTLCCAA